MDKVEKEHKIAEDLTKAQAEARAVYGKPKKIEITSRESERRRKKIAVWAIAFVVFFVLALFFAIF